MGSTIAGKSVLEGITEIQVTVDKAVLVELARVELKGKVRISGELPKDDGGAHESIRADADVDWLATPDAACEGTDVDGREVNNAGSDEFIELAPGAVLDAEFDISGTRSLNVIVPDETDEFPQGGKQ